MGTREERRRRLYDELQRAYDAWIEATAKGLLNSITNATIGAPVDTSGCADAAKVMWFNYLEARRRLIADFGEA